MTEDDRQGWLLDVLEFQRCFSKYFPTMNQNRSIAEREMDWLYTRVFGNPLLTVRASRARSDLKKLQSMLLTLSSIDLSYSERLYFPLWQASHTDASAVADAISLLDFLIALNNMAEEGRLHRALVVLARTARQAIKEIPESANVKWEAVHVIDSLQVLWYRNTGKYGPTKALNPASPFATYLREGFEILEIDADVISAFKRWAARRP